MTETGTKQHFYDMAKQFSDAMLITLCRDGTLHSRPMRIAHVENDVGMWFATAEDS
jgi:general stress protein 26